MEGESRNTLENALYTRRMVGAGDGAKGPYLLVTSAWHMPRAIGVFRRAGFEVAAYPVDYRTAGGAMRWRPFSSIHDGLELSDLVVKEWAGLFAYWLLGRIDMIWPGPEPNAPVPQALNDTTDRL